MSNVTVELSEFDADMWEVFKRGGEWVAASEYRKLKADAERMFQANVEKNNEILGLLRDNAKLLELVRHMYECMCNIDMDGNYECFSCEYENTDGLCDYERLMRELGVEVDG